MAVEGKHVFITLAVIFLAMVIAGTFGRWQTNPSEGEERSTLNKIFTYLIIGGASGIVTIILAWMIIPYFKNTHASPRYPIIQSRFRTFDESRDYPPTDD
jgi:ABC-type Fe3+ transport system permease subunit